MFKMNVALVDMLLYPSLTICMTTDPSVIELGNAIGVP